MPVGEAAMRVASYGDNSLHVIQKGVIVGLIIVHETIGKVWYHMCMVLIWVDIRSQMGD
jgi:hypothetical protein